MIVDVESHVLQRRKSPAANSRFQKPINCPIAKCSAISMYENELEKHMVTEAKLRKSVMRETALRRQKDDLLRQQDILSKESEHRLLNGLQLITSLLTLQSRAANNTEAAALLTIAANRVAAIGRVHRHLHALDHVESVEFKTYLQSLCHDLFGMSSSEGPENEIAVDSVEVNLPATKGIALGFIASELVTNALKYAKGRITVSLQALANGYELSISDDGPGLPEGFDPTASHGLGMKLVSALVRQIAGQLQIDRGENGKGARFSVMFS